MRIRHIVLAAIGLALWPVSEARAEFWTALDTVPKPNAIIAIDASVTMGIEPNACGGNRVCHRRNGFSPRTRLSVAKRDLLATIPSFQNYFVFGGFRYRGCDWARAVAHVMPDNQDLTRSFNATRRMIQRTGHCPDSERRYPGGAQVTGGCLTPSRNCSGDQRAISNMLNNGIAGITVTRPANLSGNVTCDLPGAPRSFINLQAELRNRIASTSFTFPAWGSSPDRSTVQADLCDPLQTELDAINNLIQTCTSTPADVWDMGFLSGNWCDAGTVAATVCRPTSPWYGTCICNPQQRGCRAGAIPNSDCNIMLTWKTRQQIAICETYSPRRYGDFYLNHSSQIDNIARGPSPSHCRENVALFLTDGGFGDTAGVVAEAYEAQRYYRSATPGISNMFVFHISNSFRRRANDMMWEVSGHTERTAFRAQDRARMSESFSKVLSRIYKGVYTGASMTLDSLEQRAVFHSFTVPGHDTTGSVGVSDDYLGMPSRISVHRVRDDGVIERDPLWETDHASRVSASPGGCGPVLYPTSMMTDVAYTSPRRILHSDLIGPGRTFRNGVGRDVTIRANQSDRDGDNVPDPHPDITYGRSFSFAQSRPLIVDAPRDVPTGAGTPVDAANHMQAVRTRPRIIYYQANGYVIGVHGGDYDPNPQTYGDRTYSFGYNDSGGYAGAEVFRYRPDWLTASDTRYDYRLNDLVQQPLMTGELIARELYVNGAYRTMLLGSQGKEGRGYFAVDITNPCIAPPLVTEWTVPSDSFASNEPNAYEFPFTAPPLRRPVMVLSSGLGADNDEIYAYEIGTGNLIDSARLPDATGFSYPTAPACVDVTGEGYVTHCYVLRSDGLLVRVEVTPGGFGAVVDVTPRDASNNVVTQASGRVFYAPPVAFFDADGAVSLVFGSGDYENLTQPSGANYAYKVRDEGTRQATVGGGPTTVAGACLPDGVGNTEGVFPLGAGERMISKPIVEGGMVAWTTYVSRTNGCISGDGYVYAMDYQSCGDTTSTGQRPAAIPIGPGLPTSPTIHHQSQRLLVNTSAGPTAAQVAPVAANTRGQGRPVVKRLYWRLELNSQ